MVQHCMQNLILGRVPYRYPDPDVGTLLEPNVIELLL